MKHFKPRSMVAIPVAAISLTVISCSGGQTDSSAQPAAPGLRLYVFDCGTLKADPARFRLSTTTLATATSRRRRITTSRMRSDDAQITAGWDA